jgi:LPS export ABC transporter permease LptG/LPS export ABC transporter permease LptF
VRILSRYLLKEATKHALLGAGLFTFVIFMRDVGRLLELVVRNSAPLPSVAEIFFLTLPTALNVTIPMGVLVGLLIGLSRMAADSEVIAMRATGIGSFRFVVMLLPFVVGSWLLALTNSVWTAPRSAAGLVHLQNSMKNAQVSFAVQPRVFYENFRNKVLYVQDSSNAEGAAAWSDVFLADISNPSAPVITMAERAVIVADSETDLRLHLENGEQHQTNVREPEQYSISTFAASDVPIETPTTSNQQQKQREAAAAELSTPQLITRGKDPDPVKARWYQTEFQRRLALPSSCLVLALVGIPLGLSSKKGGKATGFVLAIALVFAYYFISLIGVALSRQGKLPAYFAVWIANFVFLLAGMVLLRRVDRSSLDIGSIKHGWIRLRTKLLPKPVERTVERRAAIRVERSTGTPSRFPSLIDNYVLKTFLQYVAMVLATFVLLITIFTFFELLGDIIRNRVPLVTVGEYLINLIPSLIYLTTPLSVLVGVLVTFAVLQSSNELTAIKAGGVSIYRVIAPVLLISVMVAVALFTFDQLYLPAANTRQEALRNSIKGKPAQTFIRPDRKWIFGKQNVIYYYEHFDPDLNEFVGLSAFQFDPNTFKIRQRVFASRAHWESDLSKWVFERGWTRTFANDGAEEFRRFDVNTFSQFGETPSYFKKEVKQSTEMSYGELARYINDLKQSGFETVRLRVQLHKKFAYPVICFVMAVLAVPFSLSAGRKGALTGVAVALGIAIVYWVTSGFFEALGNVSQLPAALAAWAPDVLFGLVGGYLIFKVPT